jgi:hypothetical protein
MIRPFSSCSAPRHRGEVLYFTSDGGEAALPRGCALDRLGMAAIQLQTAQRMARQRHAAQYTFSDRLHEQMRQEAKAMAQKAVGNLLCGLVMLRAGFVC